MSAVEAARALQWKINLVMHYARRLGIQPEWTARLTTRGRRLILAYDFTVDDLGSLFLARARQRERAKTHRAESMRRSRPWESVSREHIERHNRQLNRERQQRAIDRALIQDSRNFYGQVEAFTIELVRIPATIDGGPEYTQVQWARFHPPAEIPEACDLSVWKRPEFLLSLEGNRPEC